MTRRVRHRLLLCIASYFNASFFNAYRRGSHTCRSARGLGGRAPGIRRRRDPGAETDRGRGEAPPHPIETRAAALCFMKSVHVHTQISTRPERPRMTPRKPTSTQAHGAAGLALIASITAQLAEDGLRPDARDRELLSLAGHLADRQVALEEMVILDGARMVTAAGIVRLHPAIGEARNTAIAVAKVLAAVSMFEVTGRVKDPAKVRAATARWRVHNATRAAEQPKRSAGAATVARAERGARDGSQQ